MLGFGVLRSSFGEGGGLGFRAFRLGFRDFSGFTA